MRHIKGAPRISFSMTSFRAASSDGKQDMPFSA